MQGNTFPERIAAIFLLFLICLGFANLYSYLTPSGPRVLSSTEQYLHEAGAIIGFIAPSLIALYGASALFPHGPSASQKPYVMTYLCFVCLICGLIASNRCAEFAEHPVFGVRILRQQLAVGIAVQAVAFTTLAYLYSGNSFWRIAQVQLVLCGLHRLVTVLALRSLAEPPDSYPPARFSFCGAVIHSLICCMHSLICCSESNRVWISEQYNQICSFIHSNYFLRSELFTTYAVRTDKNIRRKEARLLSLPGTDSWCWFNNDGAFNVLAERCPAHLRVGPWSTGVVAVLLGSQILLVLSMPTFRFADLLAVPALGSYYWWFDLCAGCWGLGIASVTYYRIGLSMTFVSYSMWSWHLLTARNLLSAVCAIEGVRDSMIGDVLCFVAEAIRFPALVGAWTTCLVWNFLILPSLLLWYYKEDRPLIIKMVSTFPNLNYHIFNGPIVAIACLCGGTNSGVRVLTPADLWMGAVVMNCYMLFYVGVLDRIGIHLYFVFSPRASSFLLSLLLFYGLQFASFYVFNMAVSYNL